jgi:hypothetical protein
MAIEYSNFLLFADDVKIFRAINSVDDCILLQSDISRTQGWCSANCMKLNTSKTRVVVFARKTNALYYRYKIRDSFITIKDLGVQLDSKLHFHAHADYTFSQCVRTLGLTRTVTCPFSTLDSQLILHLTLVRPKLEYASTAWNSITATDAKKLERIQRQFVALCQNLFSTHDHVTFAAFLEFLKLHTPHDRRHHLDALFFISVYSGLKCCPSLLDTTGVRVPPRSIRNPSLFTATRKTLRQRDVFRPLTACVKPAISLGSPLLL